MIAILLCVALAQEPTTNEDTNEEEHKHTEECAHDLEQVLDATSDKVDALIAAINAKADAQDAPEATEEPKGTKPPPALEDAQGDTQDATVAADTKTPEQ